MGPGRSGPPQAASSRQLEDEALGRTKGLTAAVYLKRLEAGKFRHSPDDHIGMKETEPLSQYIKVIDKAFTEYTKLLPLEERSTAKALQRESHHDDSPH